MSVVETALARVLVVDDDESHRFTLESHLRETGYDVRAASTADEALGVVHGFKPDLVITDIRMPGSLTGFDLLERLKESTDADVMLVTAFEGVSGAIAATQMGAYDYLIKPLDLERLEAVVTECLKDRRERQKKPNAQPDPAAEIEKGVMRRLVGKNPAMLNICKVIGRVASTSAPVLVHGETGTGKELIARAVHEHSAHKDHPFIAVDCTSIPETLLESELFGHTAGAFTGAAKARRGRFEIAGRGTIFLDEIGDTTPAFQSKLLRVLQEGEFYPVGSEEPRQTGARVIAATHRDLRDLVQQGRFREDLYFRLRVVEIEVPSLRERRSDIPLLTQHMLSHKSVQMGRPMLAVPDRVMRAMMIYDWPGNVRQLENALTRALVLARGSALSFDLLGLPLEDVETAPSSDGSTGEDDDRSLESMERAHVQRVLLEAAGNKSEAARRLRVSRPRLDRIIEKYRLQT